MIKCPWLGCGLDRKVYDLAPVNNGQNSFGLVYFLKYVPCEAAMFLSCRAGCWQQFFHDFEKNIVLSIQKSSPNERFSKYLTVFVDIAKGLSVMNRILSRPGMLDLLREFVYWSACSPVLFCYAVSKHVTSSCKGPIEQLNSNP